LARRLGWPDALVEDLANYQNSSDLTEKDKIALRFAERMTLDPDNIDDEFFAELRKHYDEGEVVELGAVVGLFNYFNRFNDALRMEPTK
jgi:alkylhydroperoxidase family enzyme